MAFFKDFLTKQLLKKQLKGVSPEEQEKIMTLINRDPDFFKRVGDEISTLSELLDIKNFLELVSSLFP